MRRLRGIVAATALVAAAGCSDGVGARPTASSSTSSTPTATAEPAPATSALAFVTGGAVRIREDSGRVRTVHPTPPGHEVIALAWTADSRRLGWLEQARGGAVSLFAYEPATARVASWPVPAGFSAHSLGSSASELLLVHEDGPTRLLVLDPPAAGSEPRYVPVPGVTEAALLLANPRRILVDSRVEGSGSGGGPEIVYDVTLDGRATELFTDGEQLPEGDFRNLAIGAAAFLPPDSLVYATGTTVGSCNETYPLFVVRDLAARRERGTPGLDLAGTDTEIARSMSTGGDGRVFAVLASYTKPCGGKVVTLALFALEGARWVKIADDVDWASSSSEGSLAVLTPKGVLKVDGKRVAHGVTDAAWSPH